jgi:hypothetical protein
MKEEKYENNPNILVNPDHVDRSFSAVGCLRRSRNGSASRSCGYTSSSHRSSCCH